MRLITILAPLAATTLTIAACGSDDATTATTPATIPAEPPATAAADDQTPATDASEQLFPDVIDAEAERNGTTWTISATLSSPYDTPERYADAWRVVGADGTVYAERILTHDHAGEQPFTRSESGIEIPDDVTEVVIEGRDLEHGYGGETFSLTLPT